MKLARVFLIYFIAFYSNNLSAQLDIAATNAFIQRIVKERASSFTASYIPKENGKDVFEVESLNNTILLRGSNGLSVASALNYYLKNYCHCLITWNGSNMKMPAVLPLLTRKIHKVTPYKYRYYLNYCTFNYSMSWWDWERWQKEIDWMALNGINMPLALTGEEAIWQRIYKAMGFNDDELNKFFCGPAYFSWFWMGNLDAWGGPLPQHWIDSHKELQKKIVAAERSMGMMPVLPAFSGHVPPSFKDKFPSAKLKKTNWGAGFNDVYILDPTDPEFEVIGQKFLEAQTEEYGSDHLYSADTFNENTPPTNDSSYLDGLSKKLFASMSEVDPKAVWVMQGWMFHSDTSFWKPTQIKALLNAVPGDHMILLDLYSESHAIWNRTEAYYGKPWVWNMLHNFGGNVFLWGRMDTIAEGPGNSLHNSASGNMIGIGLTPEGIEQNPALYQLMLDNVWTDKAIDVSAWLKSYALNRYGIYNEDINHAWEILHQTVYNGGLEEGGQESIISARPTINPTANFVRTNLDYDAKDLLPAWKLFIKASSTLHGSEGFKYDIVDLTRQVLANYATVLQQQWVAAYLQHDTTLFNKYSIQFIKLMDDLDKLLATRKEFLLGRWIDEAKSCGIGDKEKDLYEFNARDLITLWSDKNSKLHEYANKQWSGLISGFYKPRWQQFFIYLKEKMQKGMGTDTNDFDVRIKDWEWNWVNSHNTYPAETSGDPVAVSQKMYDKYLPLITLSNP